MMKTIADRILERRSELGLTQNDLAKQMKISNTAISKWESGFNTPNGSNLFALSHALSVPSEWLLTGKGLNNVDDEGRTEVADGVYSRVGRGLHDKNKPEFDEPPAPDYSKLNVSFVSIPLFEVVAAAGNGVVVDSENVVDVMRFRHDWIANTLNAIPNDLYLINVQGESMTPTLHPGDVILVDHRSQNTVQSDGIYVLRLGDTLLVKRVQRLPGQKLRISSDNPIYEPYELQLDEAANDELAIIGRVVWSGRRM